MCDHAYLDSNNFLHRLLHKKRRPPTETVLLKTIDRALDLHLRHVRPRRSVLIAVDGPAPMAKVLSQRRRRAKGTAGTAAAGAAAAADGDDGSSDGDDDVDDNDSSAHGTPSSSLLTPGTAFMVGLDAHLHG